jgi:hypothetical protein
VSYEKQDHHGPAFLFSIVLMPDISVNNLPSKNSRYCKLRPNTCRTIWKNDINITLQQTVDFSN